GVFQMPVGHRLQLSSSASRPDINFKQIKARLKVDGALCQVAQGSADQATLFGGGHRLYPTDPGIFPPGLHLNKADISGFLGYEINFSPTRTVVALQNLIAIFFQACSGVMLTPSAAKGFLSFH